MAHRKTDEALQDFNIITNSYNIYNVFWGAMAFELNGQSFTALNGGPIFKFNEAVSLQVDCATQEEVDYYWDRLSEGGDPNAQQCGWLKDKYGLSWQIVPHVALACIAHKSLEICDRCRLRQQNSPATPENSTAF